MQKTSSDTDMIMLSNPWDALLQPAIDWREAYAAVERAAKEHLNNLPLDKCLTTTELVEALYPEAQARGEGITARRRMFSALAALATRGMSHYCSRGEPRKMKHLKKIIRPWVWHGELPSANPEAKVERKCPHCGGLL